MAQPDNVGNALAPIFQVQGEEPFPPIGSKRRLLDRESHMLDNTKNSRGENENAPPLQLHETAPPKVSLHCWCEHAIALRCPFQPFRVEIRDSEAAVALGRVRARKAAQAIDDSEGGGANMGDSAVCSNLIL